MKTKMFLAAMCLFFTVGCAHDMTVCGHLDKDSDIWKKCYADYRANWKNGNMLGATHGAAGSLLGSIIEQAEAVATYEEKYPRPDGTVREKTKLEHTVYDDLR